MEQYMNDMNDMNDAFWSDRLARYQLREYYEGGIRNERTIRKTLMRYNPAYRDFRKAAFAVRAFLISMGEPLHPID